MIVEYKNRLAVPAALLYDDLHLVEYENYLTMVRRGKIVRLREGKGKNNHALVELETLPPDFRNKIISLYPRPEQIAESTAFADFINEDTEAVAYFQQIKKLHPRMTANHVVRHSNEAAILNGFKRKYDGILKHASRGASIRGFWKRAVAVLDGLQQKWPHKLPKSEVRLREKYDRYIQFGCQSLLKGWTNQNGRIVNAEIEMLLNAIYCEYFKPNAAQVHEDYLAFLYGEKDIVNKITGELYDRTQYEPVSESTVYGYINKWENQVVTHSKRSNNRIQFGARHRSYASLITDHAGAILSLDDRDLPWKMHNGKRPVAYIAADVASECFVGWAFSRPAQRENDTVQGKNMRLVFNMFRNMFQQLDYYGVNMPAEVEVENHLMSSLKETTLKEGNLFRYVRFAAAENPQEKKIEGLFRRLRYDFDKKQNNGLGWLPRPHARDEANQSRAENSVKYTYEFEQIVQMATDSMMQWNAALHPNQKKYPVMSRMDVWMEKQHPDLIPIDWRNVARYVGTRIETSVNRYELRCNNRLWILPSPELANKTGNNGRPIDAYYIDRENENIDRIYLYEKNSETFICEAYPKPVAHRARIEQTEVDQKILGKNSHYNKGIEKHIREGKNAITPIVLLNAANTAVDHNHRVETVQDVDTNIDYFQINSNDQYNLLDEL